MLVAKVMKFDPAPGMEYIVNGYPHNGLFLLSNGSLALVGNGCCYNIPNASHMVSDINDLKGESNPAPAATGISESFVLKALAIAQNPQLATTLIGAE